MGDLERGTKMPFWLQVVGTFRLLGPDRQRIDIRSRKSCAILAILALSKGREASRDYLTSLLWGDRGSDQANRSLRQEIWLLRQSFSEFGESPIIVNRRSLFLRNEAVSIDILDESNCAVGNLLEGFSIPNSDAFADWLQDCRRSFDDGSLLVFLRDPTVSGRSENKLAHRLPRQESSPASVQVSYENPAADYQISETASQQDPAWLSIAQPDIMPGDLELNQLINAVLDNCVVEIQSLLSISVIDNRPARNAAQRHPIQCEFSLQAFGRRDLDDVTLGILIQRSASIVDSLQISYDSVQLARRREVYSRVAQALISKLHQLFDQPGPSHTEDGTINRIRASVFDALFIPGSVDIQQMNEMLEPLLAAEPTGIDFALSNCVRMLEFGERENGNDNISKEFISEYFRRSVELDPANGLVQCVAGHVNSLWLGDHSASLEYSKRSVEFLSTNPICWTFHALALMRAGRFDEALKACNHARSFGNGGRYSGFIEAVYTISLVLVGDYEKAKSHGNLAIKLNPKFKATYKYLFIAYVKSKDYLTASNIANIISEFDKNFNSVGVKEGASPVNNSYAQEIIKESLRELSM